MPTCTLCAAEESPGFYTGCMVRDGHAPEWDCDGQGNLTRRDFRKALDSFYEGSRGLDLLLCLLECKCNDRSTLQPDRGNHVHTQPAAGRLHH